MQVRDMAQSDRPRERLARLGAEALTSTELLALVLRSGGSGISVLDLASTLLDRFGGLAGLRTARPEELAAVPGMGPAKAAALVGAFRLSERLDLDLQDARPIIRRPEDVVEVVRDELAPLRHERLLVLVCDSGNRLRQVVRVAEGSADRCPMPVREVLNAVLRHDGRAFALAHNHPSGEPDPSPTDIQSTRKVANAASQVGLRCLGHVVITPSGPSVVRYAT